MIKFQQSQALTSHFESFWSIVQFFDQNKPFFICRRASCGHTYEHSSILKNLKVEAVGSNVNNITWKTSTSQ